MSSKVSFQIYHGEGTMDTGPNGIILRGFKCIRSKIDRAGERTFGSVYRWLEQSFHINSETTILTVHIVINRANEGVWWELMPISTTNEWKIYINEAVEYG